MSPSPESPEQTSSESTITSEAARPVPVRVEHENLDRKAYQILKSLIIGRQLLPGQKIPQEKLAADLGISRTPLINALKLLEKENLVDARPRRGYFVRSFDTRELISVFELREVLEGLAARKATGNLTDAQRDRLRRFFSSFVGRPQIADRIAYAREDEAFHSFLVEASGHRFLRDILEAHDVVHVSYQTTVGDGLLRPPEDTISDHLAIIAAVCAGDAAAAERTMRTHLAKTIDVLRKQLANESGAVSDEVHEARAPDGAA
jgi:DNA-binding GntR family transcriptional regulator